MHILSTRQLATLALNAEEIYKKWCENTGEEELLIMIPKLDLKVLQKQ